MAHLTIEIDGQYASSLELQTTLELGRSSDCGLSFPISHLSRRHLRLQQAAEGWRVVDLGSTNGTWIGGERITDHLLEDGQVVRLGSLSLTFHEQERSPDDYLPGNGHAPSDAESITYDGSLDDAAIEAILRRRAADSIDEDPKELLSQPTAPRREQTTSSVAPVATTVSSPSALVPNVLPGKTQGSNLWEIAMKPVPASAEQSIIRGKSENAASKSVSEKGESEKWSVSGRWKGLLEQFDTDIKFKIGVTLAIIALFGLGGFYWLQANGFARPNESRINPGTLNSQSQAASPATSANALRDVPV